MAMNRFAAWMALAAAVVVAGCGGGEDGRNEAAQADDAGATTQATVNTLRTRLAAEKRRGEAVSPDSAAEQLLDFAESRFPMYFPGHPATQTHAPFRFRAYASGAYLGVATSAEGGYVANGVYVMGGAFGSEPTYVGLLTDFITPFNPDVPVGPTGPGNGCFDMASAEAVGWSMVVTTQHSGTSVGTSTTESRIVGPATFEGHQVMESLVKASSEMQVDGRTIRSDSETRYFARRTGEAEITEYGSVFVAKASPVEVPGVSSNSRLVYTPPFVNRMAALAQGDSLTQSRLGSLITTTTYPFPGVPPQENRIPLNTTTKTTFVGVEHVSVPAGTFPACRFHLSTPEGVTITSWQHRGSGAILKTQGANGTSEAISVIVNGVALSH
jgi:hypothetical protein